MKDLNARRIAAAIAVVVTVGLLGPATAHAQVVPTGGATCVQAGAVPACVDAVVAGTLVGVPRPVGDIRGGPLHENGGHDIDIAAHHGRMLAR